MTDVSANSPPPRPSRMGEARWPMALAVLTAAALRLTLPAALRFHDASWLLGRVRRRDPGSADDRRPRADRPSSHLATCADRHPDRCDHVANAGAAVKLLADIINTTPFTNNAKTLLAAGGAIWLTNVIAFALWYWDLDRGGAAARAHGAGQPAFVFPEMTNSQYVAADWSPSFIDYLHLSFTTATAFSPTDVSAIRPWAKLLMMAEEAISLVVAVLVVARAVNILK